jgi:uncharacterized membrane protein
VSDKTHPYNAAEIGALAHLYRGEMYRSKVWRGRLDGTTNWAVVTTGVGLSVAFSTPASPALTLQLVGLLVLVFLVIEARRYRYFDIWRTRVRLLEVCFYSPMLLGQGVNVENGWNQALVNDYADLRFHISFLEAYGRRFRRNYVWIFLLLGLSYLGKVAVHPVPAHTWDELWHNATVGPLAGQVVLALGVALYVGVFAVGLMASTSQEAAGRVKDPQDEDPIRRLGLKV